MQPYYNSAQPFSGYPPPHINQPGLCSSARSQLWTKCSRSEWWGWQTSPIRIKPTGEDYSGLMGRTGGVRDVELPVNSSTLTHPVIALHQALSSNAVLAGLMPPAIRPGAQPNTHVRFQLFDRESTPAAVSPLVIEVSDALLAGYPGRSPSDFREMIRHGAKIGYDPTGPVLRTPRRGTQNLPMNADAKPHVEEEIRRQIVVITNPRHIMCVAGK
ncbi:hypothetical protein QFC19_004104 [Naganishia cerealis]|uniref:Uncharacterized protein n=1 Tax=Naganishia cerealis TaxID=610337 RepID=A0ACC2VYB6_9TREE|nr:hypothetical protein QFC19_004104 [Naganishia cerealis]